MVQKSVITLQKSAIITDAKCIITQGFQNKLSLVACDCNFTISNVYFFIHFAMNMFKSVTTPTFDNPSKKHFQKQCQED